MCNLFNCFFLLFIATLFGCTSDKAEESPRINFCDTISFKTNVLPIFSSICANPACHVIGGNAPFPLTNHEEIASKTDRIIPALEHTGIIKMPRNPETNIPYKLSQEKIETIKCWISAGKANN